MQINVEHDRWPGHTSPPVGVAFAQDSADAIVTVEYGVIRWWRLRQEAVELIDAIRLTGQYWWWGPSMRQGPRCTQPSTRRSSAVSGAQRSIDEPRLRSASPRQR